MWFSYLCSCADTDKSVLRLWRGAVFKVPQVLSLFSYTVTVSSISVVSVGADKIRRIFRILDHLLGPTNHPHQCIPRENGCGMELTCHLHLVPIYKCGAFQPVPRPLSAQRVLPVHSCLTCNCSGTVEPRWCN